MWSSKKSPPSLPPWKIRSSSNRSAALRLKSLTAEWRAQDEGLHEGRTRLPLERRWAEEGPRPKPVCNVGSPAEVSSPETSRSCALGVFGRPLPPWTSSSRHGQELEQMALKGLSSSKAASLRLSQPPARPGLPEGKQPQQRQISKGLLTEAACVRVEGPGADFASRRVLERHSAPAQDSFRASPDRKQSPRAG